MRVRKLADKSEGTRVSLRNEVGEPILVNPETPGTAHEPWPLAGIEIVDGPKKDSFPTSWVALGVSEGWIKLEGEEVVHRPGGPPENPWAVTHTFVQADAIILDTVDGEVRYEVTGQPDKYPDEKDDSGNGFGGYVNWFYEVERVKG